VFTFPKPGNQNLSYKVNQENNKIKSPSIPAPTLCLTNTTCNIVYSRVTHYTIITNHKQIGWANNINLYIQFKYMHTHVYHTLITNLFPFLRLTPPGKNLSPCAPTPCGDNKPQPLPAHQNPVRALHSLGLTSNHPCLLTKIQQEHNPYLFTKTW